MDIALVDAARFEHSFTTCNSARSSLTLSWLSWAAFLGEQPNALVTSSDAINSVEHDLSYRVRLSHEPRPVCEEECMLSDDAYAARRQARIFRAAVSAPWEDKPHV